MELALKQRLLGAAVLVALAVVFLPLLVMDPAPDSGASSVPLRVPAAPDAAGDTRTLDLPLAPAATGAPVLPTPPAPPASDVVSTAPATAGGDYAVNFGSYATPSDATRVIAALAAAHLPGYQEPATLGARTVYRVRIGPYPTSAAAEAARLAAAQVRSDVHARVVVLDVGGAAATAATAAAPATPAATTTAAAPSPTAASPQATAAPRNPATPPASAGTAAATAATAAVPSPPATQPALPAPTATTAPAAAHVGYAVQLGAFANADEATRLRDRARAAGFAAFVEQVPTDHGTLSRVRVGPAPDRAAADALRAQVAARLGVSGIVRPHP